MQCCQNFEKVMGLATNNNTKILPLPGLGYISLNGKSHFVVNLFGVVTFFYKSLIFKG